MFMCLPQNIDSLLFSRLKRDVLLTTLQPIPHCKTFRSTAMNERFRMLQRQPRRISITLSYYVHEALLSRSEEEGRSVSNLCAFLLEDALRDQQRDVLPPTETLAHPRNPLPNGHTKQRHF